MPLLGLVGRGLEPDAGQVEPPAAGRAAVGVAAHHVAAGVRAPRDAVSFLDIACRGGGGLGCSCRGGANNSEPRPKRGLVAAREPSKAGQSTHRRHVRRRGLLLAAEVSPVGARAIVTVHVVLTCGARCSGGQHAAPPLRSRAAPHAGGPVAFRGFHRKMRRVIFAVAINPHLFSAPGATLKAFYGVCIYYGV